MFSFLLWESTAAKALAAYEKLRENIVDFNDLRVSMPHEVAGYLGTRYPLANERCLRMRTVLRSIYLREHDVTLESLASAGKREVKKYLESIEDIPPYVAARVMLLCFDTHAIPVDGRLLECLQAEGVVDDDVDEAEAGAWLSRQIKATDGLSAALKFQAWSETDKPAAKKKSTSKAKTTKKKTTTKKKSTKKTTAAAQSKKKTTTRKKSTAKSS